jgi:hypothetical protein
MKAPMATLWHGEQDMVVLYFLGAHVYGISTVFLKNML